MNKVILLGRLTRDPEVRYSQGAEPLAVVRYALAVNRRFKREGEPDADFINCVAFGKTGEFAEKYFRKGQMVGVCGRLQIRTYEKDGQKQWITEVVIEDQYFAESKGASAAYNASAPQGQGAGYQNKPAASSAPSDEFFAIDESLDDEDLPF
ncbi:MAG: single-stranded DNA-binding protein [Clostridiales bacterium]|jgi:single-strand DNA-binding protein|nr:single-stranded DNA-binding protein [Clostridiales bacterium]